MIASLRLTRVERENSPPAVSRAKTGNPLSEKERHDAVRETVLPRCCTGASLLALALGLPWQSSTRELSLLLFAILSKDGGKFRSVCQVRPKVMRDIAHLRAHFATAENGAQPTHRTWRICKRPHPRIWEIPANTTMS